MLAMLYKYCGLVRVYLRTGLKYDQALFYTDTLFLETHAPTVHMSALASLRRVFVLVMKKRRVRTERIVFSKVAQKKVL